MPLSPVKQVLDHFTIAFLRKYGDQNSDAIFDTAH